MENLNKKFLLRYANEDEFYVGVLDSGPAVAAVLQINQKAQDWDVIDLKGARPALYIHWLCVNPEFMGENFSGEMINFAGKLARQKGVKILRADTNADEKKLCRLYEDIGFKLVGTEKENYRTTAFYEKELL